MQKNQTFLYCPLKTPSIFKKKTSSKKKFIFLHLKMALPDVFLISVIEKPMEGDGWDFCTIGSWCPESATCLIKTLKAAFSQRICRAYISIKTWSQDDHIGAVHSWSCVGCSWMLPHHTECFQTQGEGHMMVAVPLWQLHGIKHLEAVLRKRGSDDGNWHKLLQVKEWMRKTVCERNIPSSHFPTHFFSGPVSTFLLKRTVYMINVLMTPILSLDLAKFRLLDIGMWKGKRAPSGSRTAL